MTAVDTEEAAEEAVERALSRAEAAGDLNAFVTLDPDAARERARTAPDGPLAGVPFVVKDCIATRDHPLTGGTPALRDHRPGTDAPVVAALRSAGAVLVGTTNLHELSFGITGANDHTGPTRNPHDRARVAGGSSAGTGAAVAAGVVPFGLAADTGGSARIPAALSGAVGFRPSTGRYPGTAVLTLSTTRDTVGVMAGTVSQVRRVDAVLTGGSPPPPGPLPLAGTRLGVPTAFTAPVDPEVGEVVDAALDTLAAAGAHLVPLGLSDLLELDAQAGLPIVLFETEHLWRAYARDLLGVTLEEFVTTIATPGVRDVFEVTVGEGRVPPHVHRHAVEVLRPQMQEVYEAVFARVDALVFPTVPVLAPVVGDDETTVMGSERVPTFDTCVRNTAPSSVAGVPSVTVPAGRARSGLPVGLSVDGPRGADGVLLAIAEAVESALGGDTGHGVGAATRDRRSG